MAGMTAAARCVDVHSHMYLPRYMKLLQERSTLSRVPFVKCVGNESRLVILPDEARDASISAGRPLGLEYVDVDEKLRFMDRHDIDASILSLANPWLEFLTLDESVPVAQELNDELSSIHNQHPDRLFGFGVLPYNNVEASVIEIARLSTLKGIKGVILGTRGNEFKLDDPRMDPIWKSLEQHNLTAFLHPHHGIGNEECNGYGHALFLALGFPFETTAAAARLILSGVYDRFPQLRILLAHSGGVLPYLIGRLDSCVEGEASLCKHLDKKPSDYLGKMMFDSVIYQTPALELLHEVAGGTATFFGTDHPFFPPQEGATSSARWPSVDKNYDALKPLAGARVESILSANAKRVFGV